MRRGNARLARIAATIATTGCDKTAATVSLEGDDEDGHALGHGHGHGHATEHLEFVTRYGFDCTDRTAIGAIRLGCFDAFPGTQKIAFGIVSEPGARGLVVTRGTAEPSLGGGGS